MELLLSHLTRRAKGGVSSREEPISAEVARVGRGADNEIHLSDPRVPLKLAALHMRGDGLHIEATGTQDFRLNGAVTRAARIKPGDNVGLGPYDLVVQDTPAGKDASVTLELVQPMGDELGELLGRSKMELTSFMGFGQRTWAWLWVIVVLVCFLGLPIVGGLFKDQVMTALGVKPAMMESSGGDAASGGDGVAPARMTVQGMHPSQMWFDISWKSGEMMNSHKFFADDCGACHTKPFVMTENEACVACHVAQQQHADPVAFPDDTLTEARCASCHKEHQGSTPLLITKQALCNDCHDELKAEYPKTTLLDVEEFELDEHPQFRPTVWTDPAADVRQRISLDDNPKEVSNLQFPHKLHLDKSRMRRPDGVYLQLECETCHQTEAGGGLMEPLVMEEDCGYCHRLSFEPEAPERTVSHGVPEKVYQELSEFYAARALEGGVPEPEAPPVVRRAPPGSPITDTERKEALAWAADKTDFAMNYMFSVSVCGSCHAVERGADPKDWTVKPVKVAYRWQPKSVFNHARHSDVECDVCHEARVSEVSSDVLLPKIDVCTQCHAGESARNKVPSTCITCHIFHRPELDLMMEPKKSAGAGHPFPMTTAGASSGSTVAGSTVAGSTLAGATVVGSGAAATTAGKEMVTR